VEQSRVTALEWRQMGRKGKAIAWGLPVGDSGREEGRSGGLGCPRRNKPAD